MTRPICTLLALLHLCSTVAADASALRGAGPWVRSLINRQQSAVFGRNDVTNESDKKAEESFDAYHRYLEEDFTIIIPTFSLEQTIDTSQSSNSAAFTSKETADEIIRTLAENHLAVVYKDSLPTVGAPKKVLLTVVTNNDDERENYDGIFIRKSFIGGAATFLGSPDDLSQSELEKVTLDAFTVPGDGQRFLDALKEENHPDLEGLLLVNPKMIQNGGPIATNPASPNSNTEDNSNPMNSIWAIAAVVALGAMFLTIILCTSVLYCDYRKRKQKMEQRRMASANTHQRRKDKQKATSPSNAVVDHLEVVVPTASGETDDQTPSPSTQGSDEKGGNIVGRGSVRGSLFKSRRSVAAKSKAASNQLQDSRSIDEHDYVAHSAPSEIYSVGEDTTTLYPSMNRGSPSKDNMSDYDGYSIDGMSAIDGGVSTLGNDNKSTSRSTNKDSMYAGVDSRDFDSIWDEHSKMTNDGGSVDGPTKEAYGDLSKPLNELIENQDEENQSSAASVDINEFDSGSESGSQRFTLELLGQGGKSKKSGEQDEEDSILGGMYDDTSDSGKDVPSGGDSVDSTPSWAAPIQSAIKSAKGIFRGPSPIATDDDSFKASSVNDKFVSSLSRTETEDGSVKSGSSRGSRGSHGSRQEGGLSMPSSSHALGLTNSADDEVDEHPDTMIDNINTMLSECRVILDKDSQN